MKVIDLPIVDIDLHNFMKRTANESDCKNAINYDCLITSGGVPKILYLKFDGDTRFIRQACKNIKYSQVERISRGLVTKGKNRIFGMRPKRPMSQFASSCSSTSLAKESPSEHQLLCDFVKQLTPLYEKYFSKEYSKNVSAVENKILPEWKIKDTPFTSGIVNKDSQLQYHYDIGHIPKCLSIMLVLKKGCIGGGLCFPEMDINIELADSYVLIMDGQELMHGVTPIVKQHKDAYRITIVYYSLLQMWKCLPITEEIIAVRKMRANREAKRASGIISKMNGDKISGGALFSKKTTLRLAKK